MGTFVTVKFHAAAMGQDEALAAQQAAFTEIATVDRLMSNWTDDSEVSLVNREAFDHPVPVSEMTFEVLEQAVQIWVASGGAFDVTVGPIVSVWRRAGGENELPSPERLSEALEKVLGFSGWRVRELKDKENKKNKRRRHR